MAAGADLDEILEDIRAGRPVLLTGPLGGRGHTVLMVAAREASAEVINFMVRHGGGLICLALTDERWDQLGLAPQPRVGKRVIETDFGVSIEAREGVTTGISAADRARTIAVASNPANGPEAISMPGHILPVRATSGGVLERPGQAEAAVDLSRLAGELPVGVICDVIGADGSLATDSELGALAREHGLRMLAIDDLVCRRASEVDIVERGSARTIATELGEFGAISYPETTGGNEHLALIHGELQGAASPLVRAHLACFGEHPFADCGADCTARLRSAMEEVAAAGNGVLLYMVGSECRHDAHPDPKLESALRQMLKDLGVGEGAEVVLR